MNDLETSVLTARLHDLADEMTPVVDPRRQVAAARAQHHRKRRVRITLIAVATATAAVVAGTAVVIDLQSAGHDGDVADRTGPTTSAPATTPPTTAPATPSAEAITLPAGWEARSFQGMTFGVPPGARMADYVEPVPPQGDGPTFIWNGPGLGDDRAFAHVKLVVGERGAEAPSYSGYESVTVRGAEQAFASIGPSALGNPADPNDTFEVTSGGVEIFTADAHVHLDFEFEFGPAGEQMARDLIATLDVSTVDASAGTLPDGDHFVQLYNINRGTGRLVIEPAEWLGTGRSWDCVPENPGPYGTVDDVTEYCVGTVHPRQTIEYTATEFTVIGHPPHEVDATEFEQLVDATVWDSSRPEPTPMLGWVTVEGGKVVAFEEVARMSA